MEKESLIKLKSIIIEELEKDKIMNQIDKVELMINMSYFLKDVESYNKNIKKLKLGGK